MRLKQLRRLFALSGLSALAVTYGIVVPNPAGATGVDETVTVNAIAVNGANTVASLDPSKTYLLTVTGTYVYNGANVTGNAVADAECSTLPPDTTFQRSRYMLLDPSGDALDLYVNGAKVEWEASTPDSYGCNSRDHIYHHLFRPTAAGPLNFRVYDPGVGSAGNNDNFGSLSIHVTEELVVDTVAVPSTAPNGVLTHVALDPTRSYRLEARGTYTFGTPLQAADALCAGVDGAPLWVPNLYGKILAPNDPAARPLGLYVDGRPQTWTPLTASPLGCDDTTHAYAITYKPQFFGLIRLAVNDVNTADNAGTLNVRIIDVGPLTGTPTEQTPPRIELADTVVVNSAMADGANTVVPLVAGVQYLIESTGTFAYGAGQGDTECSTQTGADETWRRERFTNLGSNLVDLFVNHNAVEWQPTVADAQNCNSSGHVYRDEIIPAVTGPMNFTVNDVYYGDNAGSLTVKVYRIKEIPLGSVMVNSSNPAGASSIPLLGGQQYRFAPSGTYTYWSGHPGTDADVECSQAAVPPYNDPTYQPNRFGAEGPGDLLDVFVNGGNVRWTPRTQSPTPLACDPNHEYDLKYNQQATGSVNFRVNDQFANYGDNSGVVTVNLFLQTG